MFEQHQSPVFFKVLLELKVKLNNNFSAGMGEMV